MYVERNEREDHYCIRGDMADIDLINWAILDGAKFESLVQTLLSFEYTDMLKDERFFQQAKLFKTFVPEKGEPKIDDFSVGRLVRDAYTWPIAISYQLRNVLSMMVVMPAVKQQWYNLLNSPETHRG